MTGVRLRIGGNPRPAGSYFAWLFAPVLPRLGHLTWLLDAQAFRPPLDPPDAQLVAFASRLHWVAAEGTPDGGSSDPHHAAGPGFVAGYAAWANDGWNWLCGFERPPADWRGWLQAGHVTGPRWQAERAEYLSATTAVCFFAVDHVYWEFFAHDAGLARAASETAAAGGLVVVSAVLAESVGL